MIPDFFTVRPQWREQIEEIMEMIGRVNATESLLDRAPELRRTSRIQAVHSSTAIEGNSLNLSQAVALAEGEQVIAPPREVLEVENALAAYEALDRLDPWSIQDLLTAHRLMTAGLTKESGKFRSVDVDIVNAEGEVLHSGSRVSKVPRLMEELLEWRQQSEEHPLVVSSAVHFLIEHVHPFRDGNGRIGRLWPTLILSRWRPTFAWLPTETLIKRNQTGYYAALQGSREPEIDAAMFIDFMMSMILETLRGYETGLRDTPHVGINVGIKASIIDMLQTDPTITAAELGGRLGKSPRTIERHLAALVKDGTIAREGSKKAGQWVVKNVLN